MTKKVLTSLDLAKNEIQNAVGHRLAAAPSSPVEGQSYYDTTDHKEKFFNGTVWVDKTGGSGTGDVSSVETSSVDGQAVVFNGTSGKSVKKSTISGLIKGTSGVLSAATAGTDYLTESSSNTLTNKVFDANGSGNTISNLEIADFAANVVDDDSTLSAASSTRVPTQAATKSYVDNAVSGLSWKQAVRAATTANGALSTAFASGQTVDGVSLVTGDRILIKNQSTASENGIYVVNASGSPTRSTDADSGGELVNASVFVSAGTVNADTSWTCTTNATIVPGSTSLTFVQFNGSSVASATTTLEGKVELATAAEAEARTDAVRAVTPVSLANFPVKKVFTIGNGSFYSFTCTHNLGTKDVVVDVYEVSTGDTVECGVRRTSTSAVSIGFETETPPTTGQFQVVIMG